MSASDIFSIMVDCLWYIAFVLIIAVGVYCTVKLKGVQFTHLREMCHITFSEGREHAKGMISSFQVFCMSMGSRIGVGNITGPILAIIVGGPGAILWMWVFALIGMATSFVETIIGQIYKEPKENGGFRGGPAYTVTKGASKKKLGALVGVIMILMYLVGYVSMEAVSMSESVGGVFSGENTSLIFAIVLTVLVAIIIFGGVYRVADLSVKIVPAMAIIWFVICIVSILFNGNVWLAFKSIFEYAFVTPETACNAFIGGVVGSFFMEGMKRGVWSNEAGIGTITNLSSMADVKHPVTQGYSQCLGVLLDVIVSTMSALVILSFADFDSLANMYMSADIGGQSIVLLQSIFGNIYGNAASWIVMIFMIVFALTCLMSDYVIAETNLMVVKDSKAATMAMRLLLLAVVFISAYIAKDEVAVVVDLMLATCAFVNTYVFIRLSKRAFEAYDDYKKQKAAGIEEPVFHKSCLSGDTENINAWDD